MKFWLLTPDSQSDAKASDVEGYFKEKEEEEGEEEEEQQKQQQQKQV